MTTLRAGPGRLSSVTVGSCPRLTLRTRQAAGCGWVLLFGGELCVGPDGRASEHPPLRSCLPRGQKNLGEVRKAAWLQSVLPGARAAVLTVSSQQLVKMSTRFLQMDIEKMKAKTTTHKPPQNPRARSWAGLPQGHSEWVCGERIQDGAFPATFVSPARREHFRAGEGLVSAQGGGLLSSPEAVP